MAKTQIAIPTGKVCEDCEDLDKNFDEVADSYPLATEVIDNSGYAPVEFICDDCNEHRIWVAIG